MTRKALLVMFICAQWPFVKHINDALVALGNDYKEKPLGIVAVSSNDVSGYPEDSPDHMRAQHWDVQRQDVQ